MSVGPTGRLASRAGWPALAAAVACGGPQIDETRYANGELALRGARLDGQPHGEWVSWTPDGVVSARVNFDRGVEHGSRLQYFEDGTLAERGVMRHGQRHGSWTLFYPSGQPMASSTYHMGVEQGVRTEWYENRQKRSEALVRSGVQHGPRTFWHDNGTVASVASFKAGVKSGLEVETARDGSWVASRCFDDDSPVRVWTAAGGDERPDPSARPCASASAVAGEPAP